MVNGEFKICYLQFETSSATVSFMLSVADFCFGNIIALPALVRLRTIDLNYTRERVETGNRLVSLFAGDRNAVVRKRTLNFFALKLHAYAYS